LTNCATVSFKELCSRELVYISAVIITGQRIIGIRNVLNGETSDKKKNVVMADFKEGTSTKTRKWATNKRL
jgi:hypothetical protein